MCCLGCEEISQKSGCAHISILIALAASRLMLRIVCPQRLILNQRTANQIDNS